MQAAVVKEGWDWRNLKSWLLSPTLTGLWERKATWTKCRCLRKIFKFGRHSLICMYVLKFNWWSILFEDFSLLLQPVLFNIIFGKFKIFLFNILFISIFNIIIISQEAFNFKFLLHTSRRTASPFVNSRIIPLELWSMCNSCIYERVFACYCSSEAICKFTKLTWIWAWFDFI